MAYLVTDCIGKRLLDVLIFVIQEKSWRSLSMAVFGIDALTAIPQCLKHMRGFGKASSAEMPKGISEKSTSLRQRVG